MTIFGFDVDTLLAAGSAVLVVLRAVSALIGLF